MNEFSGFVLNRLKSKQEYANKEAYQNGRFLRCGYFCSAFRKSEQMSPKEFKRLHVYH